MFSKIFKRNTVKTNPNPIALHLTFAGHGEQEGTVDIAWTADNAPHDVIFDIGFLGGPSGVLTRFAFDNEQATLSGVFRMAGDEAFQIKEGWAYSGVSQDGSGVISQGWTCSNPMADKLDFAANTAITLHLAFDSTVRRIQHQ